MEVLHMVFCVYGPVCLLRRYLGIVTCTGNGEEEDQRMQTKRFSIEPPANNGVRELWRIVAGGSHSQRNLSRMMLMMVRSARQKTMHAGTALTMHSDDACESSGRCCAHMGSPVPVDNLCYAEIARNGEHADRGVLVKAEVGEESHALCWAEEGGDSVSELLRLALGEGNSRGRGGVVPVATLICESLLARLVVGVCDGQISGASEVDVSGGTSGDIAGWAACGGGVAEFCEIIGVRETVHDVLIGVLIVEQGSRGERREKSR